MFCLALVAFAACKGPPARLVAGTADTIVVNNRRPVQLPMRVFDAAGHHLDSTRVRYQWTDGVPVPVSATGVVTCTQPGDATVHAALGSLTARVILRCRPVGKVRALRMVNMVVGDSAQELPFDALDVNGRPVTLLTGELTVSDNTIATVEGQSIRARAQGVTDVTMRIGDRSAGASVHVYERVASPEVIRPGEHLAVSVRVAGGEMRSWRLPASPETYFLTVLPDRDGQQMPRLAVVGAQCGRGMDENSFFCLAQHGASVTVYHPQHVDSAQVLSGTLAIWLQGNR